MAAPLKEESSCGMYLDLPSTEALAGQGDAPLGLKLSNLLRVHLPDCIPNSSHAPTQSFSQSL